MTVLSVKETMMPDAPVVLLILLLIILAVIKEITALRKMMREMETDED